MTWNFVYLAHYRVSSEGILGRQALRQQTGLRIQNLPVQQWISKQRFPIWVNMKRQTVYQVEQMI
jgi:hypothetical protein